MIKNVKKVQIGISIPVWMAERINNDLSGTNSEIVMSLLVKKYGDFDDVASVKVQRTEFQPLNDSDAI